MTSGDSGDLRAATFAHAAVLHAAGSAANEDMLPRQGLRLLRRALTAARGATSEPERQLRGRILVSLAMAEAELNDLDVGLALIEQALDLLPHDHRAIAHAQRAILLRRAGRDDDAVIAYDTALGQLDERRQPELVAKVLLNRGVVHTAGARLRQARTDLTRAYHLAQTGNSAILVAKIEHDLGYLEYVCGDLPAALGWYARVEPQYADRLPGTLAMLGLDRARVLLAAGMVGEADRELAAAVDQLGRQRSIQDQAEGLLARADTALLNQRPADARRWAAQAVALFRRRENPRWVARARLVEVRAELDLSDQRPRPTLTRRAEMIMNELAALGMPDDTQMARLILARCALRSGQVDEGDALVGGPRPNERLEVSLLRSAVGAELADLAGRGRQGAARRRAALRALQRARTRLGALDLQGGAAVIGRELADQGIAWAIRSGSAADLFGWAERARAQALLLPPVRLAASAEAEELRAVDIALAQAELTGRPVNDLRTRRGALRRRIRAASWATAGPGRSDRSVSLRAVRDSLSEAAMLVLIRDGVGLHALVVTAGRTHRVVLGTVADAEEATLRLRADLDARAGRALPPRMAAVVDAAAERDAAALAGCLIDPVLPIIGDRELVIVPTGPLITVPWSMLPALRGRPVTVAPSATSWMRRQAAPPASTVRTLLASGPRIGRGDSELAAIDAVRSGIGPTQVLTGARADVTSSLAALRQVDVAHLAAHGRHETDNPLFSGLELSDGLLMGYDLLALPRTPALVVLSACDLGLNDCRPGDESLGMASALLAAGTQTVVASVARVGDEEAMATMVQLHRGLVAGRTPAQALAGAVEHAKTGFVCIGG